MSLKTKLYVVTAILGLSLLILTLRYTHTKSPILYAAAVTSGTTFYHFAMRLLAGGLIHAAFHNRMDYTKKWFQEKPFEPALYRALRVKQWKKLLPALNPEDFHIKTHSASQLIQASCQAEIVHEMITVLSFIPLLFPIWFGSAGVFLITSCLAALLDAAFVMVQRYNRPRLLRLIQKQSKRGTI